MEKNAYQLVVNEAVQIISEESGIPLAELKPETPLDSLGMDSLDILNLFVTLGVPYSDACKTVGDLAAKFSDRKAS